MATNINVEFSIIGDKFKPEKITEELKIEPDECWLKGEKVPGRPIRRKDTTWSIETGYEETLDVVEMLNKMLNRLRDKKEILCELKEIYQLEYYFNIITNIEDYHTPEFEIHHEFIEFANDIKAEIGVPIYIF